MTKRELITSVRNGLCRAYYNGHPCYLGATTESRLKSDKLKRLELDNKYGGYWGATRDINFKQTGGTPEDAELAIIESLVKIIRLMFWRTIRPTDASYHDVCKKLQYTKGGDVYVGNNACNYLFITFK